MVEILEMALILGILYFGTSGILMLTFNTDSYWMAVISNSMLHEEWVDWQAYYTSREKREFLLRRYGPSQAISQDRLYDPSTFPIQDGFGRGDLLFIKGVDSISEISVGDVVIIKRANNIPLTHRIFAAWEENGKIRFTTKGDHNSYLLNDDAVIYPEQIIGKVVFVIPKLGNISLWYQGK